MSTQNKSTDTNPKVIFLHGLGQTASVWDPVIQNLSTTNTFSIALFEDFSKKIPMDIDSLNSVVTNELSHMQEPYILCGLSLGGIIALQQSILKDPLLKGIIVSAGQFEAPNRLLLTLQKIMFRFLPKKTVATLGLTKKQLLELTNSLHTLHLRSELKEVDVPTLLICGLKDKANLTASKELTQILNHANLKLVQGKHELNKEQPEIFAKLINNFLIDIKSTKYSD